MSLQVGRVGALLVVLLALGAASCGARPRTPSSQVGKPLLSFPEPQALSRFLERPLQKGTADSPPPIEQWVFDDEGAGSDSAAVDSAGHPATRSLSALAAQRPELRFTREADCVAREVARVYEQLERLPDARFVRFAQGRCGLVGHAQFMALPLEAPTWMSDAERWQLVEQVLFPQITERVSAAPSAFGLAIHHGNKRTVFGLVWAVERVRLDDARPMPDPSGYLTLQGKLTGDLTGLHVLVNQGEHDSAECELVRSGRHFRARCPMLGTDWMAWIDFVAEQEGVLLGKVVGSVWAHRGEYPSNYVVQSEGTQPHAEDFSRELAQKINMARARARRARLVLSKKQSATASALAPHLFQAMEQSDASTFNTVSLGLLAGWNLGQEIRGGSLYFLEHPGRSPDSWLLEALESPLGRRTLLDGDDSTLSLGVDFDERTVRVVVNTYRVFASHDHKADEEALLVRLGRERLNRGLSKLVWAESVPALDEAAAAVASGEQTPEEAMNDAMYRVARRSGYRVHAMFTDTYRIKDVRLDERLLTSQNLTIALRVTHYRPPGAAWSQLAVLMLAIPQRTR